MILYAPIRPPKSAPPRGMLGGISDTPITTNTTSDSAPMWRFPRGTAAATLKKMAAIVNASLRDPRVIQTAREIVSLVGQRDTLAQMRAIRSYLQNNFRFVRDPFGQETLTSPSQMLKDHATRHQVMGDCDDAAVLGAALGKAVGLNARFVAVGFGSPKAPLSHVYAVLHDGPGRHSLELDTTRPLDVKAARVARAITQNV